MSVIPGKSGCSENRCTLKLCIANTRQNLHPCTLKINCCNKSKKVI